MVTENHTRYAWYAEGAGSLLIEAEKSLLEQVLPMVYGFHLIQVADPCLSKLVSSSIISHRVLIHKSDSDSWPCSLLRGKVDVLPVKTNSVDAVVLSHSLEQATYPHQVLRETHRILLPEGHLIITGLNPYSLWGIWYRLSRRWKHIPRQGRLISLNRMRDWLELLDFKVVRANYFFFRPPIARSGMMHRLQFMEKLGASCWPFFGGAYQIVAVKRVVGMTPIRPKWKSKQIWSGEVVAPSARQKM
jgi:SAM-dependent methyltransferase